ncbi:DMT family transporter [Paenibacillus oceani]|uniref:EamA family transporter n=1 Tax=Paenibacillus oceani TaxID=2772510 RepID=A0A927CIH8_9BACL|nr:DMT family transporter [Paenibacillus oceani]MBD2866335.1 EamA family transporter [Paenibacillus oceani]
MVGTAVVLVLGSGFMHSLWNLYTKKSIDKNVFLWYCQLVAIVLFLPWTILEWDSSRLSGEGLVIVLVSMALHGLYVVLLAAAYSAGDLSQVYPIMRGTSPLLVPVLGVTLYGESLSAGGWAGIGLIVVGIALLSSVKPGREASARAPASWKAPLLALAVGVCIAGYIAVDKAALEYVPAVVLNEATNIGNLLALSWAALRSGRMREELRANGKVILLGGVIAPGGYLLFLFALSIAPVAQLAPMREIGTVFGTILGVLILREQQGARRILTTLLITLGVITVGVWG